MKGSSPLRIRPSIVALFAALIASGMVGAGLLWARQLRSAPDQLNLPADLAKYKEWKTQLPSPTPVPLELWLRCMAPTPSDWAQAEEKYGPHTQHYIQVYANQIATQTLRKGKAGPFPTGAILAKEKLTEAPQGTVAGVAFMIKRDTPQFSSSGGWEFAYYPKSGDSAGIEACAICHRSAASKDYVFAHYPSSGDPLRPTQTHFR
jgi:Cytochrome P460